MVLWREKKSQNLLSYALNVEPNPYLICTFELLASSMSFGFEDEEGKSLHGHG